MDKDEWVPGQSGRTMHKSNEVIHARIVNKNPKVIRPEIFGIEATREGVERVCKDLESEYELRAPLLPELERAFASPNEQAEFLKILRYGLYDADTGFKQSNILKGGEIRVALPEVLNGKRIEAQFANGMLTIAPRHNQEMRGAISYAIHDGWLKVNENLDPEIGE